MPAIRGANSKSKTRRRARDLDQVHSDLRDARHLALYKDTKAAEDLPGLGEHYCVECAKWFEGEHNLVAHRRGKPHKRRVRQLKDDPYTQKDSEAAVGLAIDNGATRTAMDTDMEAPDAAAALMDVEAGNNEAEDAETHDAFFAAYQANQPVAAR